MAGQDEASQDGREILAAWRARGGVGLCGACSRAGACQLGIRSEALGDDGIARFDIVCPDSYESGPGVAHGGWISAVFADALPHVVFLQGHLVVTGTLSVRYIRPVPIRHPLVARGWVERVDGMKWHVSGELLLASSGAELATATGVWVERERRGHYGGFQDWLAEQGSREITGT
jgi:acyl-coenzyme A thioesterase PaaI-like protein